MTPAQPIVLVVDDDPFMLEVLADFLGADGCTILTAAGAAEALALMAQHQVQVVVSDQCMPLMDGTAFLARARQLRPDSYRIMLTALDECEAVRLALARGDIDRHLAKPWDGAELRASLRRGLMGRGAREPV